ncbi:MAG: DUF374 domain-containing protein [Candidatus Dadabacteria bacterium]|nr:MAG: DUF374 domain-containing protein [Candidatus Dadabacteria bacterium]
MKNCSNTAENTPDSTGCSLVTKERSRSSLVQQLTSLIERLKIWLVGNLGALLLYLIARSLRWELLNGSFKLHELPTDRPFIVVFWHARQLMLPYVYLEFKQKIRKEGVVALISRHRDGRYIAEAVKRFGIESIAGSSTRGGKEALNELVKQVKNGKVAAVTPDGPRGPARKVKPGVVVLAARTKAPVYPIAYSAKNLWRFNSWDKMILPKPFSKAVLAIGEPITVKNLPPDGDLGKYLQELESRLNMLTDSCDEYFK